MNTKKSENAEGLPDWLGRYDRNISPLRGFWALTQPFSIIISTFQVSKSESWLHYKQKVLFHNDDYTSMEFVVFVLQAIFHKSRKESTGIMLEVHHKGIGIVGIYTYEVASTNIYLVEKLAEEYEYPFKATMEKV